MTDDARFKQRLIEALKRREVLFNDGEVDGPFEDVWAAIQEALAGDNETSETGESA